MKDINSIINEKFKDKKFEKSYHRTATFYRLADELLLLRKKRGLSQKELAEAAGTTQAVVSRLENASVKASLESVVKFADALDAYVDVKLVALEYEKEEQSEVKDVASHRRLETQKELRSDYYPNFKQINEQEEDKFLIVDLFRKPAYSIVSEKPTSGEFV